MKTTILDSTEIPHTEGMAVLQALASRSLKPLREQLLTVTQDRSETFINKHVIGYNHDSVLDATNVLIGIEDVSMFVAKAIQDDPLYKGTECSTRYIDFSTQRFYNPYLQYEQAAKWLDRLRKFYVEGTPVQIAFNRTRFPREDGQVETVYENAIKAKAFDVMRGFLPAGATTNLNWVGDLRVMSRRLQELRYHPLKEVQNLAYSLIDQLVERYPASVKKERMSDDVKTYMERNAHNFFYLDDWDNEEENTLCDYWSYKNGINLDIETPSVFLKYDMESAESMNEAYSWLKDRPKYGPIPRMPGHAGIRLNHTIDYGSFRDIQRHRNCIQKIPILTCSYGFEEWYLENLAPELHEPSNDLLEELFGFIDEAEKQGSPYTAQYLIPMGYKVPNTLDMSIPQAVYMAELRSNGGVHPTARRVGTALADFLEECYPFIAIYPDRSESQWDIKRGLATITSKE